MQVDFFVVSWMRLQSYAKVYCEGSNKAVYTTAPVADGWAGAVMIWAGAVMVWAGAYYWP